MEIKVYELKN